MMGKAVHSGRTGVQRGLVIGVVLALLAWCGDGTATAQPTQVQPLPFHVSLSLISANSADVFIAQEKGYFKQAGVDVQLENQGGTATTNAAAGRVDLTQTGVSAALAPFKAGRPTSIVYEVSGGLLATGVIVKADAPYKSLMDLSGKSIVVLTAGGAAWGAAQAFSQYIVKQGGQPLQISVATSGAGQVSSVVSGVVQGSIGTVDIFGADIAAGKLRLLLQPNSPLAQKILGRNVVNAGYWGLKDVLSQKREAATRFVAGLRKADQWLATASQDDIIAVLMQSPFFKEFTRAQIIDQLKWNAPFFTKTDGFVNKARWDVSLKAYSQYGLPGIDVNDSIFGYTSIVDMSFWNAADPIVASMK